MNKRGKKKIVRHSSYVEFVYDGDKGVLLDIRIQERFISAHAVIPVSREQMRDAVISYFMSASREEQENLLRLAEEGMRSA